MPETIIAAVAAFVGTNIDDIFINTLLFAQADTRRRTLGVALGVFIGIGTLVAASLLGAFGLRLMAQDYVGLLGFVPIALGIKEWLRRPKSADENSLDTNGAQPDDTKHIAASTALLTIAGGADNLGVYIPLFAEYSSVHILITIAVFAIMTVIWCVLGKSLANLPVLRKIMIKYRYVIIPVVFISLGVYIILSSFTC